MPNTSAHRTKVQWTALLVLVLGLAATALAWWRERELARRDQVIRWQETLGQVNPLLHAQIGTRFEAIHDIAKATLLRGNASEASWKDFVKLVEWQQRFPGMVEIGYAEPKNNFASLPIKFLAAGDASPHKIGFDLLADPAIRDGAEKTANAGYGCASEQFNLGSNQLPVVVGFDLLPVQPQRPSTPTVNRANVRGVVFFALNHEEYFKSCQPLFAQLPLNLRLLAPDEPAPPKTLTQRPFTVTSLTGEWRLVATMKTPALSATTPQWIVLFGGIALSLLLFRLFSTQTRLRHEAEASREKVLTRDAEIMALNRDLERKISERTAELNEALTEEKDLNRLKSNFISMVTHEIRTPLALILGSSEILSRYLDRLSPEKRIEHLATIDSAVERMSALIEDVLLFSRAEAGRMDFNPVAIDLGSFCVQLMDELASATNRRCPVELCLDVGTESARGDEHLLRHIFANLVTNASKYSEPGTPIHFSVKRDEGDAVFVVRDQGLGIPAEDLKRLFTPFYRGKNVATIQGTGLGLIIVKHCVERHGGTINVFSTEKVGTTVTVRLPLFSPAHTNFLKKINAQSPTT